MVIHTWLKLAISGKLSLNDDVLFWTSYIVLRFFKYGISGTGCVCVIGLGGWGVFHV
jgi:hypothetical protein